MRHLLALPALLRASLYLAAASPTTFSVNDDLLAFPQFEVKFTESYFSELQAQSKLHDSNAATKNGKDSLPDDPPSEVQQYLGTPGGDGTKKGEQEVEYEYMLLEGQRYLCSIPVITPANATGVNDTVTIAEEEKELARATDRGWELLSGMKGNCVYFISGWWSYRFCYGDGVKQFHQLPPSRGVPIYPPVEDPSVEGYNLGNYEKQEGNDAEKDAEKDDVEDAEGKGKEVGSSEVMVKDGMKEVHKRSGYGELVQRGESRYLVQRLGGGTKCDLTGKERKVEVQFHCNPQSSDRISLIKETSTCAYLMVIQTPRLCNDVAFQPPQKDQPNTIWCSPILADDEVEDYERDVKAIKSADKEARIWEANAEAAAALGSTDYDLTSVQIVGDIIVGGHAMVPEGIKQEKSAIVGGGKETYIDTVASSDGRILSEDDMKRLGLGDPRAVEKLRKELEKIAQGQQWKLDVIDTPHGREYRGIIGDDEDEGGKKKEKKKDGGQEKKEKAGDTKDEKQQGSEEEYYKEEL